MKACFTKLLGNEGAKKRIGSAIVENRVPHAFLIDGQDGSGKMTLALQIAAALNCENKKNNSRPLPCGECNNCRRILEGGFVDVHILERRDDKATIGVKDIKELRSDMFLSSHESDYRIYIIDGADRMTPDAQNAMLIVLEEPPQGVVIMLLAEGTDRILTTIKSRTQYVSMSRFTQEEIKTFLKKSEFGNSPFVRDEDKLSEIAVGADGRIGEALRLIQPHAAEEYAERREDILRFIRATAHGEPFSVLHRAVSEMPTKRQDLLDLMEGIMQALGDMILAKRGYRHPSFFTSAEEVDGLIASMSSRKLTSIYDIVNFTHSECSKNANLTALLTAMAAKIKAL